MRRTVCMMVGLLLIALPFAGCSLMQQLPPADELTQNTTPEQVPPADKPRDSIPEQAPSADEPPESTTPEQVPPDEDREPIEYDALGSLFAIASEDGDRLITFTPMKDTSDAANLTLAIGENGQAYLIEFSNKQDRNDQDTGRVTSWNFDNMDGYVYNVVGKKAVPNQTYFISREELISEEELPRSTLTEPRALDSEETTPISDVRRKMVRQAWIIADYDDGIQLQLAVFEPDGDQHLMSIVLKTEDGTLKFMDYPAVSKGHSVWRVDDGGQVDPTLFSILFAVLTDKGWLFAVSWAGAEGENTFFLLEQTDTLQEQPVTAYRYWSPA